MGSNLLNHLHSCHPPAPSSPAEPAAVRQRPPLPAEPAAVRQRHSSPADPAAVRQRPPSPAEPSAVRQSPPRLQTLLPSMGSNLLNHLHSCHPPAPSSPAEPIAVQPQERVALLHLPGLGVMHDVADGDVSLILRACVCACARMCLCVRVCVCVHVRTCMRAAHALAQLETLPCTPRIASPIRHRQASKGTPLEWGAMGAIQPPLLHERETLRYVVCTLSLPRCPTGRPPC